MKDVRLIRTRVLFLYFFFAIWKVAEWCVLLSLRTCVSWMVSSLNQQRHCLRHAPTAITASENPTSANRSAQTHVPNQ